ncbi:accessory factor associated with RNA polymerase II [Tilletia horrida]|nr:accessory factor associated with RNA polymerase II [Tilletia horrida]
MDALDALRAAVKAAAAPDNPLSNIEYRAENDTPTDNLVLAETIVFTSPAPSSFSKLSPTRVLKSAKALDPAQNPNTHPDAYLPLEALVFAIQTRSENLGAYVRQATGRGIARLAPTERNPVLDYLLGKTDAWSGVHPATAIPSTAGSSTAPQSTAAQTEAAAASTAGPVRSTTPPIEPPASLIARYAASHKAATSKLASPSKSAGVKRAYVPSRADADFVKRLRNNNERSFLTREDSLHGTTPWLKSADFVSFRNSIQPVLVLTRKGMASASGKGASAAPAAPLSLIPQSAPSAGERSVGSLALNPSLSSSGASTPGGPGRSRSKRPLDPILLLSNSPTSLINMFNVKKLLEEGVFVSPDRARQEAGGMAEAVVQISHMPALVTDSLQQVGADGTPLVGGGLAGIGAQPVRKMRFLVVDNADALQRLGSRSSSKDAGAGGDAAEDVWNRVVAVFTTGQTWQFKSYKYKDPRELFKHAMGVNVRYSNENLMPIIRDWNITQLQIEPSKRHTDKQLVGHFWRTLEAWMMRRKPFLMPVQPV